MTEEDNYYNFLGHFVERFALVELLLYEYFAGRTGMHESAIAIFGNISIGETIKHITKLNRVQNIYPDDPPHMPYHLRDFSKTQKDLKKVIEQIRFIHDFRNTLLHNGTWGSDSKERITSKKSRILAGDPLTVYKASTDTLEEILDDLELIINFLQSVLNHLWEYDPFQPQHLSEKVPLPVLESAWRYKPPQDPQKKVHKHSDRG